jgi:Ca2+-transporting ATPase
MQKWHNLSVEETLKALGTDRRGLSESEARKRLERHGPNELSERKKSSAALNLLRQFMSPLIYILLAAALVELVLMKKPADAGVILVVVFFNAAIGFIQEHKAERAMEALKRLASPQAKALRGKEAKKIPANLLVPGDVVLLEAGDRVPADGRLLEAAGLAVDESILTGESVPVSKFTDAIEGEATTADMGNMVHMGCSVSSGRGVAVVASTGMNTGIGRITAQVQDIKPPQTPLQKNVAKLGRSIGLLVLGIIAALIAVGIAKGYGLEEIFTLGVAAVVSAIPEGLPVMVTVVLALGMRRMARRNALIRKLPAVETMGSVTVICSDKTGTLTESEMTVREFHLAGRRIEITGAGYNPDGSFLERGRTIDPKEDGELIRTLEIGALCNDSSLRREGDAYHLVGDPTEGALLVAAMKAGLDRGKLEEKMPRLAELPFESEKRYMATLHPSKDGKSVVYVKGAVERVLEMSRSVGERGTSHGLTEKKKSEIMRVNEEMASGGLRVMALAFMECEASPGHLCLGSLEGSLTFVALVGVMDPPRKEAGDAVHACARAGIKVVMITGDQPVTAKTIAEELGLPPGETVSGLELAGMDDEEFRRRVEGISVFARVEPLQKLRIVEALKSRGYVVAMTGDGVNDGPALRSADIGIAMGVKGTDVAREASDMVLTDDNFASIVSAVEEGRVIFGNIRRSIFYLLSTNVGELLTWIIAIVAGIPLPLAAVQILWVNLVTDGVCTLPLGVEAKHGDVLDAPPRRKNEGIMHMGMFLRIAYLALFMAFGTYFLFKWELGRTGLVEARTIAFCALVAFQWFNALNARSATRPLFRLGVLSNKWLAAGLGLAVALQAAVVYVPFLQRLFHTAPVGIRDWGIVLIVTFSVYAIEELRKLAAPNLFKRGK